MKSSDFGRHWREKLGQMARGLLPILLLLAGRASLADHYYVPTGSMEPTLRVGDHLAVDKRAYGLRVPLTHLWLTESSPHRGDVAVLDSPAGGQVLVKRVVGLPGDELVFDGTCLFINGRRIEQSEDGSGNVTERIPGASHPLFPEGVPSRRQDPVRIPDGQYFVMGDHRGNSADSRYWGLVPRDHLLGKAVAVLFSPRSGLSFGERWWIPLVARGNTSDARLYH